jgi:hypothetical protein
MSYIGRGISNLASRTKLDALIASATATYNLLLNSVAYVPSSAESLTVSLNGVIQAPTISYTVSGSTIVFASSLADTDSIDFILAERAITLTTVGSGSVGTSQLVDGNVTNAKLENSSITLNGSSVSLGGSATIGGGKIGQVVNGTYSTLATTTSSTFVDTGISLAITPSAESSKIFISIQNAAGLARSNQEVGGAFQIVRTSTAIWTGAGQTFYQGAFGSVTANEMSAIQTFNYLDSPSTTSATTYKLQHKSSGAGHTIKSQYASTPSIITLMEVLE